MHSGRSPAEFAFNRTLGKYIYPAVTWAAGGALGATSAAVKGGFQHIKYALTIKKAEEKYKAEIARLDEEKASVFTSCDELLKE